MRDRSDGVPPGIKVRQTGEELAALPPLARIEEADLYRDYALAIVGYFAEIRRGAVAEAHAQGLELDLSAKAIRGAVRPDRTLLQSALRVLAGDGVCSLEPARLERGLAPRASLVTVTQAVLAAVPTLVEGRLSADEDALVSRAYVRARRILPDEAAQQQEKQAAGEEGVGDE